MSAYRVLRTDDLDAVRLLDRDIFGPFGDDPIDEPEKSQWWLVCDARGDYVGFGGARRLPGRRVVLLERAGVLSQHRGRRLHERLVRARLRWAGDARVITYTAHFNTASSNTMIRCGFRLYEPDYAWAGRDVLYWMRCKS